MASWVRALRWVGPFILFAVQAAAAPKVHVVADGQTLGGIAKRYRVSVAELTKANGITRASVLRVGQELTIPERTADRDASRKRAGKTHVVADGQTLGAIARRYNVTIEALASANAMRRNQPLSVGRELVIPEKGAAPPAAAAVVPVAATPSAPPAEPSSYTVVSGDTLGSIALRHDVTISSLARANAMQESDILRIDQVLTIPPPGSDGDDIAPPAPPATPTSRAGMQELDVAGAGPVYYFEPVGPGRLGLKPVIMYLHGRGGDPARDCQRWAPIARQFGWLVCPSGKGYHNSGRTWNNSWAAGYSAVTGALRTLRDKYGRRVQLRGNTLVGFSEGAFVAMNVGVRAPQTFNRLLILGASDGYLGALGPSLIAQSRASLRRVYLLTGERDSVVHETRRAGEWFREGRVPLRVVTPASLAHEVALERERGLYRGALSWLSRG